MPLESPKATPDDKLYHPNPKSRCTLKFLSIISTFLYIITSSYITLLLQAASLLLDTYIIEHPSTNTNIILYCQFFKIPLAITILHAIQKTKSPEIRRFSSCKKHQKSIQPTQTHTKFYFKYAYGGGTCQPGGGAKNLWNRLRFTVLDDRSK